MEKIREYGCIYCVVDPAYLSIGAGINGDDMNNVNKMGSVLSTFNRIGHGQACTMLCHHYTKAAAASATKGKMLSHSSLAALATPNGVASGCSWHA